jgi:hypothetical protein
MIARPLIAMAFSGLLAAGCSSTTTTTAYQMPVASPGLDSARAACASYGLQVNSTSYNNCVVRESEMRRFQAVDYAEARAVTDAANACLSYGLNPAMVVYDRCVAREVDERRPVAYVGESYTVHYRQAGYSYDASGNRVDAAGYPIDPYGQRYVGANNYRPGPGDYGQPPAVDAYAYAASPQYPNGPRPAVTTDEFGFRYDVQGNRIDRNGNIISPQSTMR